MVLPKKAVLAIFELWHEDSSNKQQKKTTHNEVLWFQAHVLLGYRLIKTHPRWYNLKNDANIKHVQKTSIFLAFFLQHGLL